MKIKLNNYTFDASAKTVTFTDYAEIRLDCVLLITNVTDNVIIYNFAADGLGGTVSTNVLTLEYNTTSMDDTDKLQIFYEDPDFTQEVIVDINQPLTDDQLRDTPVIVDTGLTTQIDALTDTELRATPLSVTETNPLDISTLATESKQDDEILAIENADTNISGAVNTVNTTLGTLDTSIQNLQGVVALEETLQNIKTAVEGTLDVNTGLTTQTDGLTDTQLRATPIDVDTGLTVQVDALTDTQLRATPIEVTETSPLDISNLATSSKQDDIITAIEAIPGGSGVQYTEGDTDATITGTAILFEDTSDTLATVSAANPLPVSATIDTTGLATSANQQTDALTDTELRATPVPVSGTVTANTGLSQPLTDTQLRASDVKVTLDGESVPVTATDLDIRSLVNTDVVTAELSAVDNAVLDTIAAKDFATQTTLAAINTKLVTGTDIGDVTINNASGGSAVNIQDGGNTITVDGTVTANATLAAETTKVIGTVNISAAQSVIADTELTTADLDTGAGTDTRAVVGLVGSKSGGGVLIPGDATAGLKVDLGADNDVTVTNVTAANLNMTEASASAIKTAVELIDNAVSGAGFNVTQQGGVAVSLNTGVRDAGTQRVTIATNDVVPITDNSGSLSVDWNGTQPVTGSGTATGALRVELPTNGTGIVGLAAGTNSIGKLAANSGVDIGDVDVTSIAAGTNNIGQVSVAPQTANGLSVFNATSSDGATALTSTAQVIKGSAGQVYGWYIYNPNATAQFVQFYNVAAASVTVGTTNPLFMLTIPATSGANVEFTNGITFSNAGFSCAATSTAGGSGAPSTALDAVIFYK